MRPIKCKTCGKSPSIKHVEAVDHDQTPPRVYPEGYALSCNPANSCCYVTGVTKEGAIRIWNEMMKDEVSKL